MAKHSSQTQQSVSHQARAASSNVHSTLPLSSVTRVISDPLNQASIHLPEDGGASASTVHPALSSDSVLTGLQDAFSAMPSGTEHTPRNSLPSPNDPFLDLSFDHYSFDFPQGDSQYTLASSASSVNPRYLDSSATDITGVPSHRTGPDPWTHVDATVGPGSGLPNMNSDEPGLPSGHLRTPTHARGPSSASEQRTFIDSAYATGSRKSHHASEVESIGEQHSDIMDTRNINSAPPFHAHAPSQISSESSTITPTPFHSIQHFSNPGQTPARQPQRRSTEFICRDCGYLARTRSDLKKHSARHIREFKCQVPDCQQNKKGFATSNDRDRHMKAVHKIHNRPSKSYKCFGEGCTNSGKEWPRLDNFKQHLKKMHGEDNVDRLLEASLEWWEQRTQRQEEADAASLVVPQDTFASNSAMSLSEQFDAYRNHNYSESNQSYVSPSSGGSNMMRSISQGTPAQPTSPTPVLDPRLRATQQPTRRRVSSPFSNTNPQRPLGVPFLNTNSLAPAPAPMQKTRSHADYSAYQDPSQIQNSFVNQAVNFHFTTGAAFSHSPTALQAAYSFSQPIENEQPRRVKKARTVAGPDINSHRMADFASSQKVRPVPLDVRGHQEDFLPFVGSNPTAENVSAASPHQDYQVNIFPAPESPSKSGIEKRLEDEVHSFLAKHRSKAGTKRLSDEQIINQFRLALQTSDTMTTTSSIGPVSGRGDSRAPAGIHCPATKVTYLLCPTCQKPKKRQSDLNKHMQRHSKPYGCVFDKCHKTFGSKNDWKRHEQTQHEQQECWRCHLCFEVFFHDQGHYVEHMRTLHKTPNPEESARQNRVARNYQGRFWCGFCRKIIVHTKTDVEAINQRFDHIAGHFMQEKMASKDWVELTGKGKTKREIQEEESQTTTEGEEDDVLGNFQNPSGSTPTPSSQQSTSSPTEQTFPQESSSPDEVQSDRSTPQNIDVSQLINYSRLTPGQTQRQNQGAPSQKRRPAPAPLVADQFVVCCHCQQYSNPSVSPLCMDPCTHHFCDSCSWNVNMFEE